MLSSQAGISLQNCSAAVQLYTALHKCSAAVQLYSALQNCSASVQLYTALHCTAGCSTVIQYTAAVEATSCDAHVVSFAAFFTGRSSMHYVNSLVSMQGLMWTLQVYRGLF